MIRIPFNVFKFWMIFAASTSLYSSLLVDPNAGTVTVLFSDSAAHDDQVITGRSLGFTGLFFGETKTTVDVSTNGNLNFSGNNSTSTPPLPNNIASLAPFWSDIYISAGGGGSIIESIVAGSYYAVTYQNLQPCCGGSSVPDRVTCQVIWFGGNTTIGDCSFLPGDIVFSYGSIVNFGNFSTPVVGLNKGDSITAAPAPGTTNGVVTTNSIFPSSYFLFRPNGSGSYTSLTGCANVSGQSERNRDLYQTDIFNVISWTSIGFDAVQFNIYRNGSFLTTVGTNSLYYQDHNLRPNTSYLYEVIGVNATGETLDIGTVTIHTPSH